MGITICGEMDEEKVPLRDMLLSISAGTGITEEDVAVEKHGVRNPMQGGNIEDMRVECLTVFRIQQSMRAEFSHNIRTSDQHDFYRVYPQGKVLMPICKSEEQIM